MPNAAGSRVSRTGVIRTIESFRRIASSLSSPAWEHDTIDPTDAGYTWRSSRMEATRITKLFYVRDQGGPHGRVGCPQPPSCGTPVSRWQDCSWPSAAPFGRCCPEPHRQKPHRDFDREPSKCRLEML